MEKKRNRIRLFDLINPCELEVRLSFAFTCIIIIGFVHIELYTDFYLFQDKICSLIELIIGSFIGLLGFSVSGIAIIVTLFTKEETFLISQINGNDSIERILGSYKFLSESLAIEIIYLIVIDFCISSNNNLITAKVFWLLVSVGIYHFCFNIFYLIALIKNCIELYKIKQIYGEIQNVNFTSQNERNEARIDFILATLMNICKCSQEDLSKELINYVKRSSMENKDDLIKYFSERYGEKNTN